MYLQELVEVAIGLIFAWLILSIAVLQIQEVIANFLGKRANDLEEVIRGMLKEPQKVKELYQHPLIKSLVKPIGEKKQENIDRLEAEIASMVDPGIIMKIVLWWNKLHLWWIKPKPSYIPSSNFALAVFDVVAGAGESNSPIKKTFSDLRAAAGKLESGDLQAADDLYQRVTDLGQALAGASSKRLRDELVKEMNERLSALGNMTNKEGAKPLQAFTKTISDEINKINSGSRDFSSLAKDAAPYLEQVRRDALVKGGAAVGTALYSLLAGAEEYATETDKALAIGRKNVEEWFNNTMDRMGGWYKRWAQKWAFGIGLIVAIVLNIDSLDLAKQLWKEPALRQATAAYVDKWIADQKPETLSQTDVVKITGELDALKLPVGWNLEQYVGNKTVKLFAAPDQIPGICSSYDLNRYQFGIQHPFCYELKNAPTNTFEILLKLLGFLITAGAAMQGAPFWFDTLKKLVNIRSSGINPAEKPKEAEKPAA